ncbi:MAG: DegV family protein [Erysipelotrichaceae bacterium]
MNPYRLFTDATCDLPSSWIDHYHIEVMPMEINMDGNSFLHYPDGRNMSAHVFYEQLKGGKLAHTSQIAPGFFLEYFEPVLAKGEDVLYVCFSSGLSGTYQSAMLARGELMERYPSANIVIVDSFAASAGEGLLVLLAANKKAQGESIMQVQAWLEANRGRLNHWFTVDDLVFLKRGGRINTATMVVGSMLKIKPIMHVNDAGKLTPSYNARGRQKSLRALAQEWAVRKDDQYPLTLIAHGDCEEDAVFLKRLLLEKDPNREVLLTQIGPVIGAHSGPGTVALFFYGAQKEAVFTHSSDS